METTVKENETSVDTGDDVFVIPMENDNENYTAEETTTGEDNSSSTTLNTSSGEKKVIPLIYVQSSKPNSANKTESVESTSISLTTATTTTSSFTKPFPTLVPISNGINCAKLIPISGSSNIAYVGTLIKTGVKGKESLPQKVLLTPMKSKDGAVARIILPRPFQTTANSTGTTTTPALSVILPQGPCKQLRKGYVVTPVSQASISKKSPITIISRNPNSSETQTTPSLKVVTPNIIRQKNFETKIITNSFIKPLNILQAKTLISTTTGGTIHFSNITNSKYMSANLKTKESCNTTVSKSLDTPKMFNAVQNEKCQKDGESSSLLSEKTFNMIQAKYLINSGNGSICLSNNKHVIVSASPKSADSSDCAISNSTEPPNDRSQEDEVNQSKDEDNLKEMENELTVIKCEDILLDDEETNIKEKNSDLEHKEKSEIDECQKFEENSNPFVEDKNGSYVKKNNAENSEQELDNIIKVNNCLKDNFIVEEGNHNIHKHITTKEETFQMKFVNNVVEKNQNNEEETEVIDIDSLFTIKQDGIESSSTNDNNQAEIFESEVKDLVNGHREHALITIGNKEEIAEKESSGKTKICAPFGERARKRKGQVLVNELPVKVFAKQQENLKILPGAEDYDPFKTIEWESNGLGVLPGCDIKMIYNEYGMLEVHEDTLTERGCTNFSENAEGIRKERDPDEIYCCVACSCYGLLSEFYNENYCSIVCRDNLIAQQQAICNKIEQEDIPKDSKKKKKHSIRTETKPNDEDDFEKKYEEAQLSIKQITNKKENPVPSQKSETSLHKPQPQSNMAGDIIDLDDESSNHSESSSNASLLKKQLNFNNNKLNNEPVIMKKLTKSFKMKRTLESIIKSNNNKYCSKLELKNNNSTNLRTIESVEKRMSSTTRHFVAQDLDPGRKVDVESDRIPGNENGFPWGHYLSLTSSRPTWIRLFSNPFPENINTFAVNMKLEAIDPEHQSYFCAVSIAEIKGYRLRLHFEGFPYIYDFWVNANSPNIFPCGFCAQHGIQLQPPPQYTKTSFDWQSYHNKWNTKPAPTSCFPSFKINNTIHNLFKVGMKLEAVDRKNTFLVCVASVAGVIESRILIHFDSWGEMYDYWVDITSPYIHPIGWCKENNHELTPPNGTKPYQFSWEKYLRKTKTVAAPAKAFCLRPFLEFKRGTKLEAIDKRAPHLLRVATVKDILPYQIKIHFDGFPEHFGYWLDDDCSDIHPVGWGAWTGHPVEPPPPPTKLLESPCPTPGCLGHGNFKGLIAENHSNISDCPYSIDNINVENHLMDRLKEGNSKDNNTLKMDEIIDLDKDGSDSEHIEDMREHRWAWLAMKTDEAKAKLKRHPSAEKSNGLLEEDNVKVKIIENKDVPTTDLYETDALHWSLDQVSGYIKSVTPSTNCSSSFEKEEITGESLLMLSQEDLYETMGLSEDQAALIYSKIKLLRKNINLLDIFLQ